MIGSRYPAMFLIASVGFLSAGCSQESNTVSQQPTAATATTGSTVAIKFTGPTITAFGPEQAEAGVSFNEQPDHQAALWMHVSQSLEGTDAAIYWDSIRLKSFISGTQINASVPAKLYVKAGNHELQVQMTQDGRSRHTNTVDFSVR